MGSGNGNGDRAAGCSDNSCRDDCQLCVATCAVYNSRGYCPYGEECNDDCEYFSDLGKFYHHLNGVAPKPIQPEGTNKYAPKKAPKKTQHLAMEDHTGVKIPRRPQNQRAVGKKTQGFLTIAKKDWY